jgi:hypothetical protein
MSLKWYGLAALILASGCSTVKPEVRMIPTGDHGVGVRFSRGNALMVSNGPSGAVMLLPVRYNDTRKFFFTVAAFNTSGHPINIGSEDVRLYLDGAPYDVQDFDLLRHSARVSAQSEMNGAWADAAVEYFLTLQEVEDSPKRHDIAYRRASGQLEASHAHIQRRLRHTVATLGRTLLQTTTIDPGTTHAGAIVAEQIVIPDGAVRDMIVEVRFDGYPHRFRLNLAPSGVSAPTPTDIPAVPAQVTQQLMRTAETWHWTAGPPPTTFKGMPIIE